MSITKSLNNLKKFINKNMTGGPIGPSDIHTHAIPEGAEYEEDESKKNVLDLLEGEDVKKPEWMHDDEQKSATAKQPEPDVLVSIGANDDENYQKALTTRDLYIPIRDRIEDSALTSTTRGYSALKGPDGVAPLVGETISNVVDDERSRNIQEARKQKEEVSKDIEKTRMELKERASKSKTSSLWYGDSSNYRE